MKMLKLKTVLFLCVSAVLVACHQPETLQDVPSQFVDSDGVKIHFKEFGKGDRNLVFVHGFGCDMNAWESQFTFFKDSGRLIFIDLPGFGQSDKPETEYTIHLFATAVKSVLDALQINDPVLIGHSLGTPVCRQVIFDHPDLKAQLCDVDGVYCLLPPDSLQRVEVEKAYNNFVQSFGQEYYDESIAGFIASLFIESTPESVRNYATATMSQTPQKIGYSVMQNLVNKRYWTGEVISVPTLVICSKNSGIPENYESLMQQLYSNMTYSEWNQIGHFMMMEKPELFNKMLLEFINNQ